MNRTTDVPAVEYSDLAGYKVVAERWVAKPVWWVRVIRLSDNARFPLHARSYPSAGDALAEGRAFVQEVVRNNAEAARAGYP